ncbi:YdeI/OmpD-associated family protein [Nocardia carnea]|uniref:YdeI/OmpD-associated family protein n=1 Tax=Nocardia carnea TaxID=37328 RepID=UPI0024544A70|nr:YdeI/OmpD-associated family protein [Nocardia carnea]
MLTFDTVIELGGKTATGFRVPARVVDTLGSGKKPKVVVEIGGHTYRSTVAVYGGEYMIPLSAENRNAAGVSAGETVTVGVELDTSERTVTVPDDLAAALARAPGTRETFDAQSYSQRRAHVNAVESAKRPETRAGRIDKIVAELSA